MKVTITFIPKMFLAMILLSSCGSPKVIYKFNLKSDTDNAIYSRSILNDRLFTVSDSDESLTKMSEMKDLNELTTSASSSQMLIMASGDNQVVIYPESFKVAEEKQSEIAVVSKVENILKQKSKLLSRLQKSEKTGDATKNDLAVGGFIVSTIGIIFGITGLSLLLTGLLGITAIILSSKGLKSEKRELAIAGLALGIVSFLIAIYTSVMLIIYL